MNEIIRSRIEALLTQEYACSPELLNQGGIIYTIKPAMEQPYIKLAAYKDSIVVCTSADLQSMIQKLLVGKNRDEIFEIPFVYGQTIHYVPDRGKADDIASVPEYEYEYLAEEELQRLRGMDGFENSLGYDENGMTPTKAVYIAKAHNQIIGVAGASQTHIEDLWEMGVDVMEAYRHGGLATYLVNALTQKLLARGIVPFYSASVTNIASQMVASRCGYIPAWMDTYGTRYRDAKATIYMSD